MQRIKYAGWQDCDYCHRDFEVKKKTYKGRDAANDELNWICPHCGFDNKINDEYMQEKRRIENKEK